MAEDLELGWSLGVLFREWQRRAQAATASVPHGPRGFQILQTLEGATPRQGALAAHLGIDRTVLTYVVDDLVDAGLVERRVDPSDRRAQLCALTDAGARTLAALRDAVAASEGALLAGLPERDAAELERLVRRAAIRLHVGDDRDACRVVADVAAVLDEARAPARR
ncbi:MarR family winged helix-turn-helix transcriptional regulator [Agrococcus sp. SGAir0287]|uniref:MarR family winged helix-turn-helix transcriptional regulator n=1 Tax=Agrococcus sp. SGAir0287 TaxID=2070347 RepID=UPI0015861404|nr:MarR family transcriptional regulator [Agrococcus sp. SGAir0287]